VLDRRALNRATLERQLLLEPSDMTAHDAVERSIGLNAQDPNPPYLGLWARLRGFRRDELTGLIADRKVVRSSVLRGTQHLVTADNFLWLRPLVRPALDRARRGVFGRRTAGIDVADLATAGRSLLAGRTLSRAQLGKLLAERWPGSDPEALAWSVQALVPIVHPPPSGTWDRHGATPFTLAEEWIGRPMVVDPSPDVMIRRYLAAFGPAGVMDIPAWSGLTRLREVVESLRPTLRSFRDESGRELFDVPDAPLPDPDAVAPARFLPEFDNVLLAHADRTRLMTDEVPRQVCVGAAVAATFLLGGFVAGTWAIELKEDSPVLAVRPFKRLRDEDLGALAEEGVRLLRFARGDIDAHDVRFDPPR
jgi:hypothetical protein